MEDAYFGNMENFNKKPLQHHPLVRLNDLTPYILETGLCEEELSAHFVCNICKKTFYNEIALKNHQNLQHDADGSGSECEQNSSSHNKNDQMLDGICGFKFIPLLNDTPCETVAEKDGIITRKFAEDTSYLIVKVEGDGVAGNAAKRNRIEGMVRRGQVRPQKPPVDLRGPFTCTLLSNLHPNVQCRQIFFNCCEYSLHYREEHTKRRKAALRCQVCEKRLDRDMYPALAAQFNLPHRLTFSCRTCGVTFLSSAEYDEHNRTVHAKLKPHQCSLCNKRFTQQGGLHQHMRMHSGIRPFACTYCPKAFTQKAGLDQHLRTHTKVKPFKCVICSKCFSQSVHLRQHMRTHTNIQPFECSICGKRFKQSSHLNFHMRSHVGESVTFMPEHYAQYTADTQTPIDYFNLANLQPVQDGETLYYAAELVSGPRQQVPSYPSQIHMSGQSNVLTL